MKKISIRINPETRRKSKELQDKLGYKLRDKFLIDMINYFDKNNIDPRDKNPKDFYAFFGDLKKLMQKDSTRIIKILNKYERDYFVPISLKVENKFKKEVLDEVAKMNKKEENNDIKVKENFLEKDNIVISLERKLEKKEDDLRVLEDQKDNLILLTSQLLSYFSTTNSIMSSNKIVNCKLKDPNKLARIKEEFERLK